MYACFWYIETRHRPWYSSRLQDQKLHPCVTGYEAAAPREGLNFSSQLTLHGQRAWQASSLAQWFASQAACTGNENRNSGSYLPAGCKMHHFRQLISIRGAVAKDLLLQEQKKVNTFLIKAWYYVTAELQVCDNINDILNCCRQTLVCASS